MPHPEDGFLPSLQKKVFELTGFHLNAFLKIGVVLLVAAVGIGWTLLSTGAEQEAQTSNVEVFVSKPLTDEEKFRDVSAMPGYFTKALPVEKLDILKSKIETGEELANSGGSYADQASELLVFLYGTRCSQEELAGLDAEKSYRRLAELRQDALEADNEKRVNSIDFVRAIAATSRLNRRTEVADFRFASDAILNLDSSKLKNLGEAQKLFIDALGLHNASSSKDKTAIFLSLIADKLTGSPESSISALGLKMKDYPKYLRYYKAIDELPLSTPESKDKFYSELFTEIQRSPPQSAFTYRAIVQLLDRLINKSDLQTVKLLTKRLREAAVMASPKTKAQIDQSIDNIETRIAAIGKTIDLSGATFDGSPLEMPNGKRTTLLFWRPSIKESAEHIELLAESEWFDPWESNVLVASSAALSEEQLKSSGEQMLKVKFKVLDNVTSRRLAIDVGIDLVPYQVSLDKDGKVIRLSGVIN